ncbi:hypothetical protein GPECTOR_23g26 [Gonium pectorale]|uniref:Uncharacterized protein n=1 Tax=Gonium pectorale TaxID=33097 RepID=A0A150GH01_GONPE|nr:hypothetical protein GPECTOR_23g26 [Gonium pectorale]|eukprot:KXZ49094.1 hypothetical protein GPECTOR_23g26 [Gonium pectorale]
MCDNPDTHTQADPALADLAQAASTLALRSLQLLRLYRLGLLRELGTGILFNPESVAAGWIRVGGILFALIGWQYLGTAWGDSQGQGAQGFYRATILSRVALSAGFGLLVARGEAPAGLLVLAGLNLVGAASMWLALRRGAAAAVSGDSGPGQQPLQA